MSNLKKAPSIGRLSTITTMSETPTTEVWEVGDKCSSNGRNGTVAFVGRTQFADGDWVGVVLEKPEGKNDGSINGIRYFECSPNHGLFCRPGKITRIGPSLDDSLQERTEFPDHLKAHESSPGSSHQYGQFGYDIGDQVYITGGKVGTVKFLGPVHFAAGTWAGIKLETKTGKNDGSVMGKRYFECESGCGIFVKADQPKKVTPKPGLLPIRHTKTSALRTMKDGGDVETQSCASSTCSSRMNRSPMHVAKLNVVPASKAHEEAMNTLKSYLKEKENHVVSLTTELEQARGEAATLMQRLQKSQANNKVEASLQLQEDLRKVQTEKEDLNKKIIELEEKINQQKDEIETLKFESEEKRILELELKEIKEAQGRQEDTDINAQITLNEDIQKLQQEKLQLGLQLENAHKKILELENLVKSSREDLQQNLQEVIAEKQKLDDQLKISNENIRELNEKVKSMDTLQSVLQTATTEKQNLAEELSQTSILFTELQLKLKDYEHIKTSLDIISGEKIEQQKELENYKNTNAQLEENLKKMVDASKQENANLDTTLQVLQLEKEKLYVELQQANEKANATESELKDTRSKLETQLQNIISEKSEVNKENEELKTKNSDLEKRVQDVLEELDKGIADLRTIDSEKFQISHQFQEAIEKISVLENELQKANSNLHALNENGNNEKQKIFEEMNKMKTQNEELAKKLKEIEDSTSQEKSEYDTKISSLSHANEKFSKELEQSQSMYKIIKQELQEVKNQHQTQINLITEEKTKLVEELDKVQKNNNEMEQKLHDALEHGKKTESELKNELQRIQLTKSDIEKLLTESKQQVSDLEKRLREVLDSSTNMETSVRQELDRHVAEKGKLQTDLDETKQFVIKIQGDNEELKSSKIELEKHLDSLREQYSSQESKFKDENEKNNVKLSKVKIELTQISEMKERLQVELEQIKQNLQQSSSENEELKMVKNDTANQIQAYKQQIVDLEKLHEEWRIKSDNETIVLTQEIQQKNEENAKFLIEINEAKQKLDNSQNIIEDLKKSNDNLEKQLNTLQKQNEDLNAHLQAIMDSSISTELNVKQELQRHIEENEKLKSELDNAKQNLAQAHSENEGIKNWQIEAQRKLVDSTGKLKEKLESEAQLMREIEALQTLCSMEKSEKEHLQTQLTKYTSQAETYENSSLQSQETINKLKNRLQESEKMHSDKISSYELQIQNLINSYGDAQKILDETKKKLSHVEKEKNQGAEKIYEIDSLKAEISHLNLSHNSTIQKYEEEIDKLRQKDLTAQMDIITLNEKLVRLQNLPPPSTDIADYVQQIDFLNSIIVQKQKDITHLKAQNDKLLLGEPEYNNGSTKRDSGIVYQKVARSYCDICEEFDLHDTEDCPKQSSDYNEMNEHATTMSGLNGGEKLVFTPTKAGSKKVKPPPRTYCDLCEEFGHDTSECTKKQEID